METILRDLEQQIVSLEKAKSVYLDTVLWDLVRETAPAFATGTSKRPDPFSLLSFVL